MITTTALVQVSRHKISEVEKTDHSVRLPTSPAFSYSTLPPGRTVGMGATDEEAVGKRKELDLSMSGWTSILTS